MELLLARVLLPLIGAGLHIKLMAWPGVGYVWVVVGWGGGGGGRGALGESGVNFARKFYRWGCAA